MHVHWQSVELHTKLSNFQVPWQQVQSVPTALQAPETVQRTDGLESLIVIRLLSLIVAAHVIALSINIVYYALWWMCFMRN